MAIMNLFVYQKNFLSFSVYLDLSKKLKWISLLNQVLQTKAFETADEIYAGPQKICLNTFPSHGQDLFFPPTGMTERNQCSFNYRD